LIGLAGFGVGDAVGEVLSLLASDVLDPENDSERPTSDNLLDSGEGCGNVVVAVKGETPS